MDLRLVIYPLGESRPVINLDQLVGLLTHEQVVYLNGQLASRLIDSITGEEDASEE